MKGKGKVDNIWERYTNSNGYAYYFSINGLVALGIYSIVETTWEAQELTEQEITKIENYIESHGNHYTDNSYSVPERKNLIVHNIKGCCIDVECNSLKKRKNFYIVTPPSMTIFAPII